MRRRLFVALSVAALMSLALLSCNRNRQPEKPEPAPAEKEKIKVERVEGLKQIGLTSFELSPIAIVSSGAIPRRSARARSPAPLLMPGALNSR